MLTQAEKNVPQIDTVPVEPLRILVLDDSEVDRNRLIRLCGEAGLNFDATEAASMAELRAALKETSFDIVFIDNLLNGEDGLEALELLKQAENQSAVSIMIAGEGRIDIAVEAMRRGCSDYMTKSGLSVAALQKSVATALERRMMNTALGDERERRRKLERAVRRYANSSSVEMRAILAGALRRVRKLRSLPLSSEHAMHLADLEHSIDRLWEALPQMGKQVELAVLSEEETRHAIDHQPTPAPNDRH
jgi:CheY-like chemotaxis protein